MHARVAVLLADAVLVETAFAGVGEGTHACFGFAKLHPAVAVQHVHGLGDSAVGGLAQGPFAHAGGHEAPGDGFYRLDLVDGNADALFELDEVENRDRVAVGDEAGVVAIGFVGAGGREVNLLGVAAGAVEEADQLGVVGVRPSVLGVAEFARIDEEVLRFGRDGDRAACRHRFRLDDGVDGGGWACSQKENHSRSRTSGPMPREVGGDAGKFGVDERGVEGDRFDESRAAVASRRRGDPHHRHRFRKASADALQIGGLRRASGATAEPRTDGIGSHRDKKRDVVDIPDAGFDMEANAVADAQAHQGLMKAADGAQSGSGARVSSTPRSERTSTQRPEAISIALSTILMRPLSIPAGPSEESKVRSIKAVSFCARTQADSARPSTRLSNANACGLCCQRGRTGRRG